MIKEALLRIGLSEKEADTFISILKKGEGTASELAKQGKESRTHTYDTINKLIKKGLVGYVVKNNVKYFMATEAEKLIDYLKEKEAKIEEESREILKILPEIKKIKGSIAKDETKITVYEGAEGIKSVMNDFIREGKEIITWGATSKVKEYLPDFFIKRYLKEREKKKVFARQLFTDYYGVLQSPVSKNRKLPKEFASPTTTAIYGAKVAVFLWLEIPKVILIESSDLAKSYKKHFELMWKAAEK